MILAQAVTLVSLKWGTVGEGCCVPGYGLAAQLELYMGENGEVVCPDCEGLGPLTETPHVKRLRRSSELPQGPDALQGVVIACGLAGLAPVPLGI